jgi:hypothetical protein
MIRWKYPEMELNINMNMGDTLELDINKKWGIAGFEVVVGNPPYNKSSGQGGSKKLWDKFVDKTINDFTKEDGYIVYVHPPNWRKPENKILEKIKKNNLIKLYILDENESKKLFKCNTRADWYILQKKEYGGNTIINDKININIENIKFILNKDYELYAKIKGENNILCPNTSYSSDMKWMKNDDSLKYKYILTINQNGKKYTYSELQKNFNGEKKVILSLGRYPYPYNDYLGEYGLSCYTFGIKIETQEEGEKICKAINSEKFNKFLKNNKWGSYNIEWRMFKYIKNDFWKEFE